MKEITISIMLISSLVLSGCSTTVSTKKGHAMEEFRITCPNRCYYSANIKGDIKQLNSLWDGESKDLMAWRRIPSSAYRPGSRASRLSMPE